MRIAFVNQPWARALPPSESIAIWIDEVSRRLVRRPEVEEVVVYSRADPRPQGPVDRDGVEHRFVTASNDWRMLRLLEPAGRLRRSRRPLFASRQFHRFYIGEISRDMRGRGFDVVHLTNFSQFAPVVRKEVPSARIVLAMQCEWLSDLDPRLVRQRAARVDVVTACSTHVERLIAAAHPDLAARLSVVPNGVDIDAFAPASDGRRAGSLLFVSRVSPEKGVHVLADAFNRIARRDPEATLTIVGSESLTPRSMLASLSQDPSVRRLADLNRPGYLERALNLVDADARPRVRVASGLTREDLTAEVTRASMLLAPSLSEAFGMAIAEAMAAGLPVVASRVGGIVDVVADGDTGVLVEPGDPTALADATLALLADPVRRQAMGEAGRARAVELFSWDVVVDRLLAALAEPRYH